MICVGVFAVLLCSVAYAKGTCPCLRPGSPGTVIRYTCENGTATGVSLYLDEDVYDIGETVTITAGKDVEGNVVPAEALIIRLYRDSGFVDEKTTGCEGQADFEVSYPGDYEFRGGDAAIAFTVEGQIVNESNETQDEAPRENSVKTNGFIEFLRKLFQLFKDAAFGTGV